MTRASSRPLAAHAYAERFAIPAFNVINMEFAQAVIAAAEEAAAPVILQVSPGAIEYAGYDTITEIVFRAAERAAVPAVAHLDHCRDADMIRRALADGYDSVMFDGSRLPWGENVAQTADLVATAAATGAGIEAELGLIGGREDTDIASARRVMTTPEEAAAFVAACPVDFLAPAIGSIHRMPDDSVILDVAQISAIAAASVRPIALHGGSGVKRDQLPAIVASGVGKVNISSRMNRAFAGGIRDTWQRDAGEMDMRRVLGAARAAVVEMAAEYFHLCGAAGRAVAPFGSGAGAAPAWSAQAVEVE